MFFRFKKPPQEPTFDLQSVVANCLPDADEETVHIITAVSGLLGCICYADREFSERENQMVRNLLQTVQGIGAGEADAILTAIDRNIITISTTQATRYGRTLKELADRELRRHVLDMMLDVATVDSHLSSEEVVVLRQVTKSLGLEQADYNELQGKHRSLLTTLQEEPSAEGSGAAPVPQVVQARSDASGAAPALESDALGATDEGSRGPLAVDPSTLRLRSAQLRTPFHVVLVEPEIPPNTGNIARLCAATNTPLHLVGKLGFSIDEHAVRRAGLDYWHLVSVASHATLSEAERTIGQEQAQAGLHGARTWLLTGRAGKSIYDVRFQPGDRFVFGKESVGLPTDLIDSRVTECLAVPTLGAVRSLNLANSVSIVLFEALRQVGAFQETYMG